MKMISKTLVVALALTWIAIATASEVKGPVQSNFPDTTGHNPSSDRGVHLNGDRVTIPFKVYKYFPFIETTINGVKGKVMFDTGSGTSLDVNDVAVPLKNGRSSGRGFVGSGQSYETKVYDTVENITLGQQISFRNAGPVNGHEFSFMNPITSDIIGLIGYKFFNGYLFKLDYKNSKIEFYKNTPLRQKQRDFLKGEKVIAKIKFESRKLVNHPVIPMIIDKDTIAVTFDTGQLGSLYLTDSAKKNWKEKGDLWMANPGDIMVNLKTFELPLGLKITPGEILLFPTRSAAAANREIGITEPNSMTLGYGFLSQYKTVWDFENHLLYLLEK